MLLTNLVMTLSSLFSFPTSMAHADALERNLNVASYYDNGQVLGFSIQGDIDDTPYSCLIQHVVKVSQDAISVVTDPNNALNFCRQEVRADSIELRIHKVSLAFGNYTLSVDGQSLGVIQYSEGRLAFIPMTGVPEKQ